MEKLHTLCQKKINNKKTELVLCEYLHFEILTVIANTQL